MSSHALWRCQGAGRGLEHAKQGHGRLPHVGQRQRRWGCREVHRAWHCAASRREGANDAERPLHAGRHAATPGYMGPGGACLGLFVEEHRDTGALDRLQQRGGSGAMQHWRAAGLAAGGAATAFQAPQHPARTRMGQAAAPGQPGRAAVALGARSSTSVGGGRLTLALLGCR